jgi:hypothetical protein
MAETVGLAQTTRHETGGGARHTRFGSLQQAAQATCIAAPTLNEGVRPALRTNASSAVVRVLHLDGPSILLKSTTRGAVRPTTPSITMCVSCRKMERVRGMCGTVSTRAEKCGWARLGHRMRQHDDTAVRHTMARCTERQGRLRLRITPLRRSEGKKYHDVAMLLSASKLEVT